MVTIVTFQALAELLDSSRAPAMETHKCEHCGKGFAANRRLKYCSPACGIAARNAKRPKVARPNHSVVCQCCAEVFDAKRADAKYCSLKCRVAAHRAESAQKTEAAELEAWAFRETTGINQDRALNKI